MPEDKMEILARAREAGVKFIRLQFTDIFGVLKNVAIPVEQLEKALDGGMMFAGSFIHGFVRTEESDMYLYPDLETFTVLPWRPRNGAVARLICDVYNSDGSPFAGCPRGCLKRALARAKKMGFTMKVGPKCEFFLFYADREGKPTLKTHERAGYFGLSPVDRGENVRCAITLILEEMGLEIETTYYKAAPGQHGIDFMYSETLDMVDKIMTFKFIVRTIVQNYGLRATFMPKPLCGINGSGMHLRQSLWRGEQNVFCDSTSSSGLSRVARYYIGGLLRHARALAAITNPTVNSYKRLVPGYEAPIYVSWTEHNRNSLVRVPVKRDASTRVELRSPDPSCNPYLAVAACLAAGLDGIEKKIEPPPACNFNIRELTEEERRQLGIEILPASLKEALQELAADEVIKGALGEHIYAHFKEAKQKEWEQYQAQISPWELAEYLIKF